MGLPRLSRAAVRRPASSSAGRSSGAGGSRRRASLGHSDVAPERKQDPGELFDWARLAAAGIGLWPAPGPGRPRGVAQLQAELAEIGYPVPRHGRLDEATRLAITAFQRHFRPQRVDGDPDAGTRARLDGLLAALTSA